MSAQQIRGKREVVYAAMPGISLRSRSGVLLIAAHRQLQQDFHFLAQR